MDSHAQLEIREYATAMGEKIVQPLFPLVWEAFRDYRQGAMFLTRLDTELIARLMARLAAAGKTTGGDELHGRAGPDLGRHGPQPRA